MLEEIEKRFRMWGVSGLNDMAFQDTEWLISRCRKLEDLKKGYQDELGWINYKLEKAEARVKELEDAIQTLLRPCQTIDR